VLVSLLVAAILSGGLVQDPADSATPAAGAATFQAPTDFTGTWEYNADESVDAATGRPETARALNRRRGVGAAGPGQGAGLGATSATAVQDGLFNLYLARRATRRDLLEIAPTLQIQATAEFVTITDDLDRVLTFPSDGGKRKYQLGAAVFDARSVWDQNRFVVDIEGPEDLKISKTWFLSEDGSRLFLVIRLGELVRDARPVGVNRVYDRVKALQAPGPGD
jgi:hypothetical protein